jgi:hypothetical protein
MSREIKRLVAGPDFYRFQFSRHRIKFEGFPKTPVTTTGIEENYVKRRAGWRCADEEI